MKDLLPILEQIAKMGKPMLILAEEIAEHTGKLITEDLGLKLTGDQAVGVTIVKRA